MKKQDRVNQIIVDARTYEWGIEKLNNICNNRACDGRCKGCYVEEGRRGLATKFGVELPKEQTPITINITVEPNAKAVFKFKSNTFRWVG